MELLCDGQDKLEELHMKLMKWITTGNFRKLWSLQEYRRNCDINWFDKEMICFLLMEDVFQMLDWTELKLIFICFRFSLSSAVNVQNALERLLDSMENQLNAKQWGKHGKLCQLIEHILQICEDRYESTSNHQVYARLLDYLMKLIDLCKDEKLIASALSALRPFPFNKYHFELLELIDSIENQVNTEQCQWRIQAKLCDVINEMLSFKSETDQQTRNQLFNYLTKLIDRCDHYETINCAWNALTQFPGWHISIKVFQPLLQNYLQSSQLDWKTHRKWLILVLLESSRNDRKIFYDISKQIERNLWHKYLRKIVLQCDHMPLVLVVILLLEIMYLEGYLNIKSENIENIKNELMGRVQSLDSECPLAHSLPGDFDFDRYQVEWCARWCVHNVMDKRKKELPLVKLSNDRFEARSGQNSNCFIPIRSQFAVSSGVYFYEVTVVTSGKMMFGWSTIDTEFDEDYCDLDKLDMSQKFVYDFDYIFVNQSDCQPGDVIGCLMNNQRFVFYCNGKKIVIVDGYEKMDENEEVDNEDYVDEEIINSSSLYYATALLSPNQHCYFNFGQVEFKFPPNHFQFMDFHMAIGQYTIKCSLAETGIVNDYWFKHLPVSNKVDLFYRDKRQNECDELVKRVERDIEEGREVEEMKMELGCTRYIQTVIEEMGNGQGGEKVDVVAQWVWKIMEKTIDQESDAKLVEIIYPYLHLRIASNIENKNQINFTLHYSKHRNICIVLSNLIKFSEQHYDFIKHIRKEVFTYLTQTLTETSDEWTQLFGLIALDNLKLSYDEKKIMENNNFTLKFLSDHKNTLQYSDIYEMSRLKHFNPLPYQLHFMNEHFLNQYGHVNVLNRPIDSTQSNRPELKIIDKSKQSKVSHDLLSVRSDWRWQWVRYDCPNEKKICYFEVILLTNGPMRIGWSTKRTELSDGDKLGEDEFSIAFNGYNRIILHQNSQFNIEAVWKAGDVVRCLIHYETRRFYFFLNDDLIPLPDKLYFSHQLPYYPSLSLSAHQQVYCNFGQSNFRYPQPNIEHLELELSIQKSLLGLSSKPVTSIDIHNSSFTNAVLATGSRNNFGDLNFKSKSFQIKTISPSNANHIDKREFTYAESEFTNCETSPKQISTKRQKFHLGPQPLASNSADDHENCKQKYEILFEKCKQLEQQQNVVLIENAKLKQRNAELENEILTIKAEKFDEMKSIFNKFNK